MKRFICAAAVFAVGCSSVTVPEMAADSGGLENAEPKVCASPRLSGSAMDKEYGIWVGKGPRIVSEDGKPLPQARVRFLRGDSCKYLEVADDGRVVMNCYVSNGFSSDYFDGRGECSRYLIVECPGYYTLDSADLICIDGIVDELRLRSVSGRLPCREVSSRAVLGNLKSGTELGFDLVDGDWMPPLGWGRVEDLRVCVNTNFTAKSFKVSSSGVEDHEEGLAGRELSARIEFVREGDGFGKDKVNYRDCTNRFATVQRHGNSFRGTFTARGYFGSIDEIRLDRTHPYYYVRKDDDWHNMPERREYPEQQSVTISLRVNREPGVKKLESFPCPVQTLPPVFHPVPDDKVNRMAFGVSEDGKTAVCFGWTNDGAKVPEIFRRGVYTQHPSKDLPDLETLYIEPREGSDMLRLAGFPELRTAVVLKDSDWGGTYGSRSLADNPKLNAVVFPWSDQKAVFADGTFEGCATNLTAVYIDNGHDAARPWVTAAASNVFTKMITVYTVIRHGQGSPARVSVDHLHGTVTMPVVKLEGEYLDERFPDGRVRRHFSDGRMEKLRQ